MRVWEDGTYDFAVPAVNNVIGGGHTYESALAEVQEKLAVMVEMLTQDGVTIKVLHKEQSAYKMRGELAKIAYECARLQIVMPKCIQSKMLLIALDFTLIGK